MLSEHEICRIVCSIPPACTCTDNCPICFSIKSVGKAVEAQHKADLEEWKREKQEMITACCDKLGIKADSDDEADACWIAKWAMENYDS